jgi:hypothetical protein
MVRRRLLLAKLMKPFGKKRSLLGVSSVLVHPVQPLAVVQTDEIETLIGQIAVAEFCGLVNDVEAVCNPPRRHAMLLHEIHERKEPTQDHLAGNRVEASLAMTRFVVDFPCHAGKAEVLGRSLVLFHEWTHEDSSQRTTPFTSRGRW